MIRKWLVRLHRWFGLFMAGFLIIEGLTGCVLAFNTQLTRTLNPKMFATKPSPDAKPLDPATLAEAAEALDPMLRVAYFGAFDEGRVVLRCVGRKNSEGTAYDPGFMFLVLDPYTGKELARLGSRGYDLRGGFIQNTIPFVFDLHTTLAGLPMGTSVLAIVALIWSVDNFIAVYLTLPTTRTRFFQRWKTSWMLNLRAGFFRTNFDLHRAAGLWFWIPLFVFAWSSVYLIDTFGAYDRVMGLLFQSPGGAESLAEFFPHRPIDNPKLKWREAQACGEKLMANYARSEGFHVLQPVGLNYFEMSGLYNYVVVTDRRFPDSREAVVFLDADSGRLHGYMTTNDSNPRTTATNWLFALHNIKDPVDYLPYRVLVTLTGVVTAALSVTGIYIWWKKRQARRFVARRRSAPGWRSERIISLVGVSDRMSDGTVDSKPSDSDL